MYKILSVRHTGKGHAVLRISDGNSPNSYTVTEITYSSLGMPPSNTVLTDDEFSEIEKEDSVFRAEKKALNILSFTDVSESALRMKLLRAGFSREAADEAVRFSVGGGYLDEERQLLRAVKREAESFRGPYYIKRKLIAKGYSSRAVSEAMSELISSGELDFNEIFERLCDKMGALGDERLALAYKRGFKIQKPL